MELQTPPWGTELKVCLAPHPELWEPWIRMEKDKTDVATGPRNHPVIEIASQSLRTQGRWR